MALFQQGTFQIPGTNFNLPDFGLTERFNTGAQNPAVINNGAAFFQPQGQVLPSSTSNPYQYDQPIGPNPNIGPSLNKTQQTTLQSVPTAPSAPSMPQAPDISGMINSGWDSYTTQLNDILNNSLPDQRGAQESLALNSYNTGVNQLGQQKTTSEGQVAKQQSSSLKDLSSNVQNLFNAGNTYLGARGAADSSAANQYSYAISKMGSKARGDIQAQAGERLAQIGDIYNSELNRLESEKTQQMASISQWFSEAQQAMKTQLAQAGLNRSQDLQAASQTLYNQALSMMQNYQAEQANRRSSLEQWALNNSKTVQEAVSNLQTMAQLPQYQGIQGGMPTVSSEGQPNLFGFGAFGGNTDERKGIFG